MNKEVSRGEALGNEVLDFVNSFGVDENSFAQTIARGHKTLQQNTMRLFVATCRALSQNSTDDRNAACVALAKRVVEAADEIPLPFI